VSGIVSGFRGCGLRRSPGSAELHRAAFPSLIRDSGSRGKIPALQSRGGDGFAPSSRHGVCGVCGGVAAVQHSWNAALLRVNELAERQVALAALQTWERHSPEWRFSSRQSGDLRSEGFRTATALGYLLYVISSLRCTRKFTRGRPAGPNSTSSGVSNTCSSNSLWYTAAGAPTRRHRPCCKRTT